MFDSLASPALLVAAGGTEGVLSAAVIAAIQSSLSAALESPSGLEDAGRIDAMRALEQLVCTATAGQAQLARELDESQRAMQHAHGTPLARQGAGVAAQVAWARRESPYRGQRHLGLAKIVASELPHTWQAWREGRITEWHVTVVARETACLDLADRLAVDAHVAGDPDRLQSMGPGELAGKAAAEAARLDPASVVRRRRQAEADRHVSLRPAPDTMSWFGALLPAKDGVSLLAALGHAADSARAEGDERSRGQVMADTLVSRVVGATDDRTDDTDSREAEPRSPAVAVNLTMSDEALLAGTDDPAHLEGYGPVPAELAREIVARALDRDGAIAIRRLYTCPMTGELVAMESRARTFRSGLRRFIRLRDQVCRTPWCDAPIRHVDHPEEHAVGGATDSQNGQGLCEACNYAKQAHGWRARPEPDGSVATTLPTGHTYRTRPPAIVTIRESPLRFDFVLAG